MAIKTIEYEVKLAGITPATEQFGGTQGDHNITEIKFLLSQELFDALTLNAADQKIMYRFDVHDGEGGIWQSEPILLTEKQLRINLEEHHTRFGGKVIVYLVITALSLDNKTQTELYSFPAVVRLKNRPDGVYRDGGNYESVTSLAQKAKNYADAAEKSNEELQHFAAAIEEKLKNGEFDGVGVESAKIVNNELIITYTNGAVQNLGNVKGDRGAQGEKGDKGDMPDMSNYYTKAQVDDLVSNAVGGSVDGIVEEDGVLVFTKPVKMTYGLDMDETFITSLDTTPYLDTPYARWDAVNKAYVDAIVGDIETLLGGI